MTRGPDRAPAAPGSAERLRPRTSPVDTEKWKANPVSVTPTVHRGPRRTGTLLRLGAAVLVPLLLTACSGNRSEIRAVCSDIRDHIDTVQYSTERIEDDILNGVPYHVDERAEVEVHLEDVDYLADLARGDQRADALERADAVDALLWALDEGFEEDVRTAVDHISATHDRILSACGY